MSDVRYFPVLLKDNEVLRVFSSDSKAEAEFDADQFLHCNPNLVYVCTIECTNAMDGYRKAVALMETEAQALDRMKKQREWEQAYEGMAA